MQDNDLQEELNALGASDDFENGAIDLVETWKDRGEGLDGVHAILCFMEAHPDIDYGMPGSLVHFAERFHHKGYENELVQSLERRPTQHTAWMMNRLLNGTPPGADRDRYIATLRAALNAAPDTGTRNMVAHYLSLQSD